MWNSGFTAFLIIIACCAPASAVEPTPVCKLTPIHTGVCSLGKNHVLGDKYSADERLPFVIYSFLVQGPGGKKALVDLGPKSLDYSNRMFRKYGFFRDLGPKVETKHRYPDDIKQPHGNVFDALKRRDLAPSSINHIVFTHLHADHHGMHDGRDGGSAEHFAGSLLHVSKIGWKDNLARRRDGRWASYVDFAFGDFLLRREKQDKVRFEDNATVFPGLRTIYLGGHSVCSQAVIIETAAGPAIITSDDVYLYKLLEQNITPKVRTTKRAYRTAVDRLVSLAVRRHGILIPLHDPIVWETYRKAGPNWLTELKKHSDRAVKGYRRSRGKS